MSSTTVTLRRYRDHRLGAYCLTVAGGLVAALLSGRVELVAFAAPFVVALLTAGRGPGHLPVELCVDLVATQIIEGDELVATVQTDVPVELLHAEPSVEVLVTPSPDLVPVEPAGRAGLHTHAGEGATLRMQTQRWGRYVLGPSVIRVRVPGSLWEWSAELRRGVEVRVLPRARRLDQLMQPSSSRAMSGFHLSRRSLGPGVDFAELQDYQPGDRLRDLNRAATARLGTPIVNRYHPERSGEVVIVLDNHIDSGLSLSQTSRRAIVTTVRAAWALAQAHLSAQDLVGVAAVGRSPVWLPPAAGARAKYTILEAMLATSASLDGDRSAEVRSPLRRISPAALVVYVSPLWSERYLSELTALQATGRATVVVQLGSDHLLAEPTDEVARAARRLFELAIRSRVERLRAGGLNVVTWSRGADLSSVVAAAARRQRHLHQVDIR